MTPALSCVFRTIGVFEGRPRTYVGDGSVSAGWGGKRASANLCSAGDDIVESMVAVRRANVRNGSLAAGMGGKRTLEPR
jgi:hypothetical protein